MGSRGEISSARPWAPPPRGRESQLCGVMMRSGASRRLAARLPARRRQVFFGQLRSEVDSPKLGRRGSGSRGRLLGSDRSAPEAAAGRGVPGSTTRTVQISSDRSVRRFALSGPSSSKAVVGIGGLAAGVATGHVSWWIGCASVVVGAAVVGLWEGARPEVVGLGEDIARWLLGGVRRWLKRRALQADDRLAH
jgi:hypothetical protein